MNEKSRKMFRALMIHGIIVFCLGELFITGFFVDMPILSLLAVLGALVVIKLYSAASIQTHKENRDGATSSNGRRMGEQ